jgi:hypothetical protein
LILLLLLTPLWGGFGLVAFLIVLARAFGAVLILLGLAFLIVRLVLGASGSSPNWSP